MADWYGHSRSNYFKVKDIEKFKEFLKDWNAEFIEKEIEIMCSRCHECIKKEPKEDCDEYVKRMVDKCKGKYEKEKLVGFLGSEDSGSLPNFREEEDEKTGKTTEYDFDDFIEELQKHIEDDYVCVMEEVGAEKLRYITGYALAINNKDKPVSVNIDDIYEKAEKLGAVVIRVEY